MTCMDNNEGALKRGRKPRVLTKPWTATADGNRTVHPPGTPIPSNARHRAESNTWVVEIDGAVWESPDKPVCSPPLHSRERHGHRSSATPTQAERRARGAKVVVAVSLDPAVELVLTTTCELAGVSRSEWVQLAILQRLDRLGIKVTPPTPAPPA